MFADLVVTGLFLC